MHTHSVQPFIIIIIRGRGTERAIERDARMMIAYYYWKEPFSFSLAYIFKQTLYFMVQSIKTEPENVNNTEFIMEHNYELAPTFNVYKWFVFRNEVECIHVQRVNEMNLTQTTHIIHFVYHSYFISLMAKVWIRCKRRRGKWRSFLLLNENPCENSFCKRCDNRIISRNFRYAPKQSFVWAF